VEGPAGTGNISEDAFNELRSRASAGDSSLFIRRMLGLVVDQGDDLPAIREILFGTDIRKRHAGNFETTFGRLLAAAREVDTDDMVSDALLFGSAAGIYYSLIRNTRDQANPDPLSNVFSRNLAD